MQGLIVQCITLACALAATIARADTATNSSLTSLQRLERLHLQAAHEARLRFQNERHSPLSHGVYEDFRAVVCAAGSGAEPASRTRTELLAGARKSGIRVVLLAEPGGPGGDSWRGSREGVLFIPGSKSENGTLWFPDYGSDGKPIPDSGIRFLSRAGGGADAGIEKFTGMVLCNRQADVKLDKELASLLASAGTDSGRQQTVLANFRDFPDESFASSPDFHSEALARWDQEVEKRPLTGIGLCEVPPDANVREAVSDAYETSFRNLVTHILAQEATEPQIREALTNGHAYVAHDWMCDPTGFVFGAVNNLGVFSMGDSAPIMGNTRVMAVTPVPARLRLFHKGSVIQETTGTNLNFQTKEAGAYRVEAWLTVDGEDRPWIYSNPIYLRTLGPGDMRLPSRELSPGVEALKDFTYREGAEEDANKHKLDIYMPKGKTNSPVLFFIHGGSWRSGDRSNYPPLGNRFARAGYVTVVPSYRLAPKNPHPAQIEDVAAAFAWAVQHVAEHGGDTNRIFVAGHSAGGHLAALLALDEKYLAAYQLSPKLIHGVLALSGVYNLTFGESQESVFGRDPKTRRDASPLFHVKAGAPPFLVTYCQWDYFSLPTQARAFYKALGQAGIKSELVYIPRENHISEIVNVAKDSDPTVAAALQFMKL